VGVVMTEIITDEMHQLKQLIIETISKREKLKDEMEEWYNRFPQDRFSKADNLIVVDSMLSELDSHYKRLWDFHNRSKNI
jgi:uracil phosphoribosyltransferase